MRLLCDTTPKCYGSSSALLSILDHLTATSTAMATGVTREILATDRAVAECVDIDVKDAAAVERFVSREPFDAALIVSNLTNVDTYARHQLPFFFVDILYWYSESKAHAVWDLAEASFVQTFPGVSRRLSEDAPGRSWPREVGPLIREIVPRTCGFEGTLVNIGGARSPWILPGRNSMYPRFVVELVIALRDVLPRPILVAAGEDAVRSVEIELPSDVQVSTLPQTAFLRTLAGVEMYLTAPGLNAVFEGLAAARPLVFLPPQNATQVLQLARYERAGLVGAGLNFADLIPDFPSTERVADEAAYTAAVLDAVRRMTVSTSMRRQIEDHLRRQIGDPEAAATARASFASRLGSPGGPAIARVVERWWREGSVGD